MQRHHSTQESNSLPTSTPLAATAAAASAPSPEENKQPESGSKTHLQAIAKGKAKLKNILRALDKDYADLLQNAEKPEYVLSKLELIENELLRKLKPIFENAKSDNLHKQRSIIENFYPFIAYCGFNKLLHQIFLPMVTLDFKYLTILACYSIQSHVLRLPTDTADNLTRYLYPCLNIWSDDTSHSNSNVDEEKQLATLIAHRTLDPILAKKRETFRANILTYTSDALTYGASSSDFKEAAYVAAENYDVGFIQFILNWMKANKEDEYLAEKVSRYQDLLEKRIIRTLRADNGDTEQIFLHLFPTLNIDLDIFIPCDAILTNPKTKAEMAVNALITPLHVATLNENKNIYDIVVRKVKNLNPVCAIRETQFDAPDDEEKRRMLRIDDANFTPLHLATHHDSLAILEDLVERGADIEPITKRGLSAMRLADIRHNIPMVRILIQAYAKKHSETTPETVKKRKKYLETEAKNCMKICVSYSQTNSEEPKDTSSSSAAVAASAAVPVPVPAIVIQASSTNAFLRDIGANIDPKKLQVLVEYLDKVKARYENDSCLIPTFLITATARRSSFSKAEKETSFTFADLQRILNSIKNISYKSLAHAFYHFIKPDYIKKTHPYIGGSLSDSFGETTPKRDENKSQEDQLPPASSTPPVTPKKSSYQVPYIPTKLTTAHEEATKRIQDAISLRKALKLQAKPPARKNHSANIIAPLAALNVAALTNRIESAQEEQKTPRASSPQSVNKIEGAEAESTTRSVAPEITTLPGTLTASSQAESSKDMASTTPSANSASGISIHAQTNSHSFFQESVRATKTNSIQNQNIQDAIDLEAAKNTALACFRFLKL